MVLCQLILLRAPSSPEPTADGSGSHASQGDLNAVAQQIHSDPPASAGLPFLPLFVLTEPVHWRELASGSGYLLSKKRCYLFDEQKGHETCPAMKRSERREKSGVFTFQCEEQRDLVMIIIFYGLFLYSCFFYCPSLLGYVNFNEKAHRDLV